MDGFPPFVGAEGVIDVRPTYAAGLAPFMTPNQADWPEGEFPWLRILKDFPQKIDGTEGPLDLAGWMRKVESRFVRYPGYPHWQYIDVVSDLLKGRVQEWHTTYVSTHLRNEHRYQVTWQEYRNSLMQTFTPVTYYEDLWLHIPSMRAGNVADLTTSFRQLMDHYFLPYRNEHTQPLIERISRDVLLGQVMPVGVRRAIPGVWTLGFEELCRAAQTAAETRYFLGNADVEMFEATADEDAFPAARLELAATMARSAPSKNPPKRPPPKFSDARRAAAYAKGTCFNCDKPGHRASNCPEPKRDFLAGEQ